MNTNIERERIRAALRKPPLPIPTLAVQAGVDIAVLELFITTNANITAELQNKLAGILAGQERKNVPAPARPTAPRKPMPPTLTARALKVTMGIDAAGVAALPDPANGVPRVWLKIAVDGGRVCTTDISAKGLRKAKKVIADNGVANVAVMITGKLGDGNIITEAGLAATVKVKAAEVRTTGG